MSSEQKGKIIPMTPEDRAIVMAGVDGSATVRFRMWAFSVIEMKDRLRAEAGKPRLHESEDPTYDFTFGVGDDDTEVDHAHLQCIIADLGLEYADKITRELIVQSVLDRGYTENEADAVAEYLGY